MEAPSVVLERLASIDDDINRAERRIFQTAETLAREKDYLQDLRIEKVSLLRTQRLLKDAPDA